MTVLNYANGSIRKWIQNPAVDSAMLKKAFQEIEADYGMTSDLMRIMRAEYVLYEKTFRMKELKELSFGSKFPGFATKWRFP